MNRQAMIITVVNDKYIEQAEAELGQAQPKLGLMLWVEVAGGN